MQTVKFLIFSFWSNGIMQRVRQLQSYRGAFIA
jgi:hypothetical protein